MVLLVLALICSTTLKAYAQEGQTGRGLSNGITTTDLRVRNTTATSIQETRFVMLGGIEQWITIRGANRENPVLLILHGGPGDAQSALRSAYALYEKDFTVVQWDGAAELAVAPEPAQPRLRPLTSSVPRRR